MKIYVLLIALLGTQSLQAQKKMNTLTKNNMTVRWETRGERVFFEIEAPTTGWVAIGFNDVDDLAGNYLLMGNVINGKANVAEHFTFSPGHYRSFAGLNLPASVEHMAGSETAGKTALAFSIPMRSTNQYTKNLTKTSTYVLLMAYSREDDFQHHSMMRTSATIQF